MVDLPKISEEFTADASGYIAALQAMIAQTDDLITKVSELKTLVDSLDGKTVAVNVAGDANEQLDLIASKIDALDGKTITINVVSPDLEAVEETVKRVFTGEDNPSPVIQQVIQHVTPADTQALKTQFENVVTTDTVHEDIQTSVDGLSATTAALQTLQRALDEDDTSLAGLKNALNAAVTAARQLRNATGDLSDTTVINTAQQELLDRALSGTNVTLTQQRTAVAAATAAQQEMRLQAAAATDATETAAAAERDLTSAKLDSAGATLAAIDATLTLANTDKLLADANAVIAGDLSKSMDIFGEAPAKVGPFNDLFMTTNDLWQSGSGWLGFLNGHLQLFGGLLTNLGLPAFIAQASGLHILVDTGIEIGATLIPALIALGTFGAAAAGTVGDLYNHENDVFQVTRALQQTMYPFTNQLQAMQDAVKPEVYVLFGEALEIMNHNTGAFNQLAITAGHVLDDLGARITNALTSGDFQSFLSKATQDLSGWGTLIGNIFGILGAVMHNLPGYAEMFLSLADGVTAVLESFAQGAGTVIEWGLAVHGALLWGGLLVTGLVALQGPITALGSWLVTLGLEVASYVEEIVVAEGATATFEAIMAPLAAINPFVWVAIALGALVALAVAFANTSNAAKGFNNAMESAVQASTLNALSATFNTAISETTQKLSQANQQVVISESQVADAAKKGKAAYLDQVTAVQQNVQQANALAGGLKTLQQQYQGVQQYIQSLVPIVGSAAGALNAMNAIGITSKDLIGASKTQLAEYTTEIVAYTDAVKAASNGTGRFAAAENALSYANEDANNKLGQIDSTMKNITQDQTQLMGVLTGASSAFDTFELGQQTMTTNFGAVSAATSTATHHLGDLELKSTLAGAAMGGTSAASLTLNQSFYQQVTNAQNLINALEMQGVKTQDLTTITATAAQQMLVFAGNNTEAQAVVASLINDALGPGTVSLQNMDKWVQQNSTSQAGLTTLIGKTTVAATQLAQTLSGDLNAMMAQSIADAYGGQKAFDAFAQGILNGTTNSTQFSTAAANVASILIKQSGDNLPAAEAAFVKYAVNGLGMATSAAKTMWNQIVSQLSPSLVDTAQAVTSVVQPAFINWADKGIKYSQAQAENLWSELTSKLGPELNNNLASNVLSSQSNFETWAEKGLKLSQAQADALYQEITGKLIPALKSIPTNITTDINVVATGIGGIRVTTAAEGGVIPGYEPGIDSVFMMLSKGEGILTPQAVRALGGEKVINAINRAAQHAAFGGIAGGPANQADPISSMPGLTLAYNRTSHPEMISPPGADSQLHAVINIDGKSVFDALTPYAYQKASRNSGNANAGSYWTPGQR